jgi:hypothetical protein
MSAHISMKPRRSAEEGVMRELCVAELRKRYLDARIIHELPLRYSSNRIDLAAVTPDKIVSLEIKSSRDVADRLEDQIRAFIPVSHRIIVALAPKWNPEPEYEKVPIRAPFGGWTYNRTNETTVQAALRRIGEPRMIETWKCCHESGLSDHDLERMHRDSYPWPVKMLDVLWVSELKEVAARHRVSFDKRTPHLKLVTACCDVMTSREIVTAVCRALRERDAFDKLSDPPVASDLPRSFVPARSMQEALSL